MTRRYLHSRPPPPGKAALLARASYFAQMHVWPLRNRLDAEGWLNNFSADEQQYAGYLLSAFMYFSRPLIENMFSGAFRSLCHRVVVAKQSFLGARIEWRSFLGSVLVVTVTGERPHAADSGHLFARMARDDLRIPESHILDPGQALASLFRNPSTPVVFVDDFVGTGMQFLTMWTRHYPVEGRPLSFADLAKLLRKRNFYYCPLICTRYAVAPLYENNALPSL